MSYSHLIIARYSDVLDIYNKKSNILNDEIKNVSDESSEDTLLLEILNYHHNITVLEPGKAVRKQTDSRHKFLFDFYYHYLQALYLESPKICYKPFNHYGYKIYLNLHDINFNLEFEPLYATINLYDVSAKKKISENFCALIEPFTTDKNFECVFEITYPTPDIYLVIKFEKTLQPGDISEICDPYMKSNIDDKGKEKFRALFMEDYAKLGAYKMPFAWTAINISSAFLSHTNINNSTTPSSSNNCCLSKHYSLDRGMSLDRSQNKFPSVQTSNFSLDKINPPLRPTSNCIIVDNNSSGRISANDHNSSTYVLPLHAGSSLCSSSPSSIASRNSFPNMISSPLSLNNNISITTSPEIEGKEGATQHHQQQISPPQPTTIIPYCPLCFNENIAKFLHFARFKPFTLTLDSLFRQDFDKIGEEDLLKILTEHKKVSGAAMNLLDSTNNNNITTNTHHKPVVNSSQQSTSFSLLTSSVVTSFRKLGRALIPFKMLCAFSPFPPPSPPFTTTTTTFVQNQLSSPLTPQTFSPINFISPPHLPPLNHQYHLGGVHSMLELPSLPLLHPHNTDDKERLRRHYLFVYPKKINFNAYKSSNCSGRNILLKVELLRNEMADQSSRMYSFVDKFVGPRKKEDDPLRFTSPTAADNLRFGLKCSPKLRNSYFTTVIYHNKNPDFNEEIKIELPVDDVNGGIVFPTTRSPRTGSVKAANKGSSSVSDESPGGNLHLLFTFYHVKCGNNSNSSSSSALVNDDLTLLGYTWLPLLSPDENSSEGGKTLRSGHYSLPVCLDQSLPAHYSNIDPYVALPCIKWLDGHKNLFDLRLEFASTHLSPDPALNRFLGLTRQLLTNSFSISNTSKNNNPSAGGSNRQNQNLEAVLKLTITKLKYVRGDHLMPFLYDVLDALLGFYLISSIPVNLKMRNSKKSNLVDSSINDNSFFEMDDPLLVTLGKPPIPISTSPTITNTMPQPYFSLSPTVFETLTDLIENLSLYFLEMTAAAEKGIPQSSAKSSSNSSTATSEVLPATISKPVVNLDKYKGTSSSVTNVYQIIDTENSGNAKYAYNSCNNSAANTPQIIPKKLLLSSTTSTKESSVEATSRIKTVTDTFNKNSNKYDTTGTTTDNNPRTRFPKSIEEFYVEILKTYTFNFRGGYAYDDTSKSVNEKNKVLQCTNGHDVRLNDKLENSFLLPPIRLFHEELCLQFVVSSGKVREKALNNALFFFSLLTKSMSSYADSLKISRDRKFTARFSQPFLDDLTSLYNLVTADLCHKATTTVIGLGNSLKFTYIMELNCQLGYFTRDLFDLLDIQFVSNLVQTYYDQMDTKIQSVSDPLGLIMAKLEFTGIITNYARYLELNFPTPSKVGGPSTFLTDDNLLPPVSHYYFGGSGSETAASGGRYNGNLLRMIADESNNKERFEDYFTLTEAYKRHHPYGAFVLLDLVSVLDTKYSICQDKAITNIIKLLAGHDFDPKFLLTSGRQISPLPLTFTTTTKADIAKLYFPLMSIAISAISQLNENFSNLKVDKFNGKGSNRNSRNSFVLADLEMTNQSPMISMFFSPNSRHSMSSAEYSENLMITSLKTPLSFISVRRFLVCIAWILKNVAPDLIKSWWSRLNFLQLGQFLELLYIMVQHHEFRANYCLADGTSHNHQSNLTTCIVNENLKNRLEQAILGTCNARSEMMARRKDSYSGMLNPSYHGRKPQGGGGLQSGSSDTSLPNSLNSCGPTELPLINSSGSGDAAFRTDFFSTTTLRWKKGGNGNTTSTWKSSLGGAKGYSEETSALPSTTYKYQQRLSNHFEESARSGTWTTPSSLLTDTQTLALERNLCDEIAFIILETLELFIQFLTNHEYNKPLIMGTTRIILKMLSLNQGVEVLENVFSIQRAIINKYAELFFEEETEICYDLCKRLLSHACSPISAVRSQASASIYHLMFKNNETAGGNNFALVKMATTMSLSSIVGGMYQYYHENHLRRSLNTITSYTERDSHMRGTSFPGQVKHLILTLSSILTDTERMKEFREDKEMLIDLMYRIADSYKNSPDLRLTWLQNMAAKHSQNGNHSEAAQCLIHSAAMVNEYLQLMEFRTYLPRGAVSYQPISVNVIEETVVSDDNGGIFGSSSGNGTVVASNHHNYQQQSIPGSNTAGGPILHSARLLLDEDSSGSGNGGAGAFNPKYFSEPGLVGLLEQAASSFSMAGEFEIVNEVYKLVTPIHEYYGDAKKMASIHGKLHETFTKIVQREEVISKRLLLPATFGGATYFRVGFYGARWFGHDLNGTEYVYREPAITKLSEITQRLTNFYASRFGGEHLIECIKDSNRVVPETLDPNRAYVQITYVEPFFDVSEQLTMKCSFEAATYNLRRFVYSTPFTLLGDGRVHGQLREQYKRKTILTTLHAFPYVKTRIRVMDRDQVVLCPLEVAIEDLEKKCNELAEATRKRDPKILAMVLQGSLGPTVNQGPLQMAITFLSPVVQGLEPPTIFHNKLRVSFKLFMLRCREALDQNALLLEHDQHEYHKQLKMNYVSLHEQLSNLINNKITQNYS